MTKIGLVVLGANGYMSTTSLEALVELRREMQSTQEPDRVEIELLMLADPAYFNLLDLTIIERSRRKARKYLADFGSGVFEMSAETAQIEIIQLIKTLTRKYPELVLFYDASPMQYHEKNCQGILLELPNNIFYLGEKPIFSDPASLSIFNDGRREGRRPNVFCDFIETQNPAIRVIKKYISDQNLEIESMKFWRAGSSGIKHILGHNQQGVQGGAMLDKGPHDFSITVSLLDPARISEVTKEHCDSTIFHFVPDVRGDVFLTVDNSKKKLDDLNCNFRDSRSLAPADGLAHACVNWPLKSGKSVKAEYLFGWLGVPSLDDKHQESKIESDFVGFLSSVGYNISDFVLKEKRSNSIGSLEFMERQIRMVALRCSSDTKDCWIVCNLLLDKSMMRWTDVISMNGPDVLSRERIYQGSQEEGDYPTQKRKDLTGVFREVIYDMIGKKKDSVLGPEATYHVHKALLLCRDKAFEKLEDRNKLQEIIKSNAIKIIIKSIL